MLASYSFTPVLFLLFLALFAQTAFLPTTISISNETRVGLHIVNEPGTPLATDVTRIPVFYRPIVLAFLARGQPIPENEVKDTLVDADQAIADLARDHPTQRITNDRFEYRRPNGNMLISISTNFGEEITWKELDRIIQALHRYMTAGIGTEETHYQTLEFEIEAGGQEKPNIGLGLVWYFGPTEGEIKKRVTLPPPISLTNDGTLRLPVLTLSAPSSESMGRLPNTTLILQETEDVQETTIFPIPKTSLSLSFDLFGLPIPAQNIKATLQGAMADIRRYLNGPYEKDPIDNDAYRWILPLSREAGIPVAVTVFTYHGHKITWRQLFDVLFGLYAFTTTFGTELDETHYQILGFRVLDQGSQRLGVGTISYFRSKEGQLAKRAETAHNGSPLRPPSAPSLSLLDTVSSPIVYPVPNTDVTLTFTFLGSTSIPPLEIIRALSGARHKISHKVAQNPDKAILQRYEDISAGGRVSTNLLVYHTQFITWREVDLILMGVLNFCLDDADHDRVLVFEIDIEAARRGRVGFGTLLYLDDMETRALAAEHASLQLTNSTILSKPSRTALAIPFPYPIPGTPITLTLSTFGFPIPSVYVNAAFTHALRRIQTQVNHHPNVPIPNGRWEYRGAADRIGIYVFAYSGSDISWQELSYVLAAVRRFMTQAGDHRCRDLGFYIDKAGEEEATGYGSVVYYSDGDNSVDAGQ